MLAVRCPTVVLLANEIETKIAPKK